jgi:hypothetical protein
MDGDGDSDMNQFKFPTNVSLSNHQGATSKTSAIDKKNISVFSNGATSATASNKIISPLLRPSQSISSKNSNLISISDPNNLKNIANKIITDSEKTSGNADKDMDNAVVDNDEIEDYIGEDDYEVDDYMEGADDDGGDEYY